MKQLLFILVCALVPTFAVGQCTSSQERPQWVDGFFQEENNSYIEVVSADGYDEENARNKAATIAIERRSLSTGKRVKVEVQNNEIQITGNDELTVKSRIIDEYSERCGAGQYRVHLLIQTAKNPTFDFERVNVTNKYDFSPRIFVPGMAQIHKGSVGKGVAFIAGEAVFVGGIVVAESLRASYESKINSTHNAQIKQNYIDNANTCGTVRNIAIAGAAALYVWNVIDGWAAKGKKHVSVLSNNNLKLTPYLVPDYTGKLTSGMTLTFKF
ncbi:MAG: hypothetical protein LBV69_02365 [Bacteroidales bacterium]|jgi:hypothetical protein|nr:hypothetical protein [Bacteroidales bacterium]